MANLESFMVAKSSDLPENGRLLIDTGGRTIGIFRIKGELYAYDSVCPHQGGPVCQGRVMPKVRERISDDRTAHGMYFDESEMHIVCPWHGAEFVIETGLHATVAELRLSSIKVHEEGGEINVSL